MRISKDGMNLIRASEPAYPYLRDDATDDEPQLCSRCFSDVGLALETYNFGEPSETVCPNCGAENGVKITFKEAKILAYRYYVLGSVIPVDYGGAPTLAFNEHRKTSDHIRSILGADLEIFENLLGVGFFDYGPNLWMLGEVTPLKSLQNKRQRSSVIEDVMARYPTVDLTADSTFFRIRLNPDQPSEWHEYDSPPSNITTAGRYESEQFPVMYCSPDIETCIHECRTTNTDSIYLATLSAARTLKLLDLTHILEEDSNAFESLDLALHYVFQARSHSYEITRSIAAAAKSHGYDGMLVPSHFSALRTGAPTFQTLMGLSVRQIPKLRDQQKSKQVPNILIFGHPLKEENVKLSSINRVYLEQAMFRLRFAPLLNEDPTF